MTRTAADRARARRLLQPILGLINEDAIGPSAFADAVEAIAEALEAEREAVLDRLHGCIMEYLDSDPLTGDALLDVPGLIKELRKAGEID
jgi:hypothetical protein